MKVIVFFSAIAVLLSSCASQRVETSPQLQSFDKGLQLMHGDEPYQAKKLWELVCTEGLSLACWAIGKNVETDRGLPILQGATDGTSTQVTLLGEKNSQLRIYLRDGKTGQFIKESKRKEASRSHSQTAAIQMHYQGLKKAQDYQLIVADRSGKILDHRVLRTLPAEGKKLRFALASCMDDTYLKEQKTQWADLIEQKPEVLLMTGDNVYVDIKHRRLTKDISPEVIWQRYVETWQNLEIYRVEKLIPTFATWDDHDYGLNNAGMDFVHKDLSKTIFEEFYSQETNKVIVEKGPGVSQIVRLRDQTFLLLDDRSFRTASNLKEGQAHFGEAQEKWILKWMKKFKGPVWLINGGQFFGGYHPHESYQGNHPKAFERFLVALKKTNRRYVFVSGDRHLTELMKLPRRATGFQTYELTSSGIHSMVFPGSFKKFPNPLAIEAVDGTMNYMLVTSEAKGRGVSFEAVSYGPNKKVLFKRQLKVQ